MRLTVLITATLVTAAIPLLGLRQKPDVGAQFDVGSIKLNKSGQGNGFQIMPDGSLRSTGMPISVIVRGAAAVPVFEVVGLPDWAKTDGYDIIAKSAPGANPTREERAEMLRHLLIERMKFVAHIEEQERNGFALMVDRSDRRLGPQLTKSTLDCAGTDFNRCGGNSLRFRAGSLEALGMRMDEFAGSLRNTAGGVVTNRTGLDGWYDIKLQYAPTALDPSAPPADAPQFVTALREQLGLKLVPEKTKVNILVVDHIERPTPN